ncbi:MAG: DUF4214 domain-containing protein [Candidatus Competibacteraceae bacterium]|nr:DUF4214 domain-containing protein [Candidatus Competibacteraceae bacterium]
MTLTIQNGLTTVHTDTNAATVSNALSQTPSVARQTAPTGNEDNPFKPTDTDRDGAPDAIEVTQGSNPLVKDNDVFTSDTRFIQQIYRDLLGREADTSGFDFWRSQLTSGMISRTDLIAAYLDSPEFQSQEGAIARLYHAAFDRMPDATGFAYWVQQIQQGASLETISASFLGSPEWAKLAVASDEAFVDHLYHTVLRRDPDAASQAFWEGQLAHGVSRASVLLSFTESLENRAALASKVAVDMLYLGLLDREGDIWDYNYWVSVLESGAQTKDQVIDAFLKSQEFHDRVLQADVTIDTTAPTATVTPATIQNSGYAVVQSSETGTAYLVNDVVIVTSVSDITSAADNRWNQVSISNANTDTYLAAMGLADGAYHVYAVDAAGNLSAASTNSLLIDTTPPTATVTAATIQNSGHAVVQSSETGTAYLVKDTVTVTGVSDITGAADNTWNSVAITSANTDTDLTAMGLVAGTYHVYTEDAAGNLSAQSNSSVTVTFTNNTTQPDQSVVVFDIGSGQSSCHSNRTFDANTSYTIYIIFPNEDGEGGIGTLSADNQWSGAENLGADDMVILVGSSTYPLGASGYSYRFIDQLGSATKSMITIRQTTHEKGYISSAMTSAWITLHNNGKLTYNSKYSGTHYIFQSPPDLWEGTMGNMTHPGDHYLLDINTSQGNDTAKMPYGLITSQLGLG